MTEAELLSALEAATRKTSSGDGATVAEIVDATGVGAERVRVMLRRAIRDGRVRVTRKYVTRIDGAMTAAPAYIFVPMTAKAVPT